MIQRPVVHVLEYVLVEAGAMYPKGARMRGGFDFIYKRPKRGWLSEGIENWWNAILFGEGGEKGEDDDLFLKLGGHHLVAHASGGLAILMVFIAGFGIFFVSRSETVGALVVMSSVTTVIIAVMSVIKVIALQLGRRSDRRRKRK